MIDHHHGHLAHEAVATHDLERWRSRNAGKTRVYNRVRQRRRATDRSRREPQVGEPIVDTTARGVRVRVLVGVKRVGAWFHA
jgi:hypothetical protein